MKKIFLKDIIKNISQYFICYKIIKKNYKIFVIKMFKLFSFGSISLSIIFPLIVPILYIIRTHLRNNVIMIKTPEIENSQNITILNIPLVYLGDLFSIIFVYISKKKFIKKDNTNLLNSTEIQPVISPVKKKEIPLK